MRNESRFKESLTFSVQTITHASSRFHLPDLHRRCRSGERCGGAIARPDTQESLRNTDTDAAQEETPRGQEITDTLADAETNGVANSPHEKENISYPNTNGVVASKEKTFANRN